MVDKNLVDVEKAYDQARKIKKAFKYIKRGFVVLSPVWLGLTIYYLIIDKTLKWPFILLILATFFGYRWFKQHKAEKVAKRASNVVDVKAKEVKQDVEEEALDEEAIKKGYEDLPKSGEGLQESYKE